MRPRQAFRSVTTMLRTSAASTNAIFGDPPIRDIQHLRELTLITEPA
jgi:hypothetical protein